MPWAWTRLLSPNTAIYISSRLKDRLCAFCFFFVGGGGLLVVKCPNWLGTLADQGQTNTPQSLRPGEKPTWVNSIESTLERTKLPTGEPIDDEIIRSSPMVQLNAIAGQAVAGRHWIGGEGGGGNTDTEGMQKNVFAQFHIFLWSPMTKKVISFLRILVSFQKYIYKQAQQRKILVYVANILLFMYITNILLYCQYCLVWATDLTVAALVMILVASFLAYKFSHFRNTKFYFLLRLRNNICICSARRKTCDTGSSNFTFL